MEDTEVQRILKTGNDFYGQENYSGACEEYQKALKIEPKYFDADIYHKWGSALHKLKQYEKAIEKYRIATEKKPDFAFAYNNWGLALANINKDKEAIEKYRIATEKNPKYDRAYNNWGLALANLKQYEDAIEKYETAIKINPSYADAYNNWGLALANLKQYEEAIEKFKKATKNPPEYAFAYNNWGLALANLNKDEDAIEKYETAIKIDPSYVDAYYNCGVAFYDLKKYEKAIEKSEMAINKKSDFALAYNNLGNVYYNLKQYEKAIENYLETIEINPEHLDYTNWNNALNKLTKDEKDKTIKKFHKTIENKPDFTYAYNMWGLALNNLKKYEESIEKYETAIGILDNYKETTKNSFDIKSFYANAYCYWGLALTNLKKYEEAIEKYEKAIKINPTHIASYNYWGFALTNFKKYEEAIEKYEMAKNIDSKYVGLYLNWGNALSGLLRFEDAIKINREILKICPYNLYAIYASHNIADILWMQGKYAASWKEWEKACEKYETEAWKKEARKNHNADYFLYFGYILHEVFREFDKAEKIYKEGIEINPDHVGILTKQVSLYLEIMDQKVNEQCPEYLSELFGGNEKERLNKEEQNKAYWKAKEAYNKAASILNNQSSIKAEDVNNLLQLGELHLAMEEYDKAEICLLKVLEKDEKLATANSNLGIVYTRSQNNKDYKKSIKYFENAYNLQNREDLIIQSNLAEAYLNSGDPNKAKIEYKKILGITPFHVESHIGLGEVYSVMGADGDEEVYDKALFHFNEGIKIARNETDNKGSKIFTKKELAAALYSRGYVKVKLYELSKPNKDEDQLNKALDDFKECFKNDSYNHKAKRAIEKIETITKVSPQKLMEKWGPFAVFFLASIVFISSLSIFFMGKPFVFYGNPITLDAGYYVLLTFSSILFMIAGLYLPQILKIKVGGVELEKSSVEQMTTRSNIGISK